jgi:hypothetical protein
MAIGRIFYPAIKRLRCLQKTRNPAREAGFPLEGREAGQRSDLGLFRMEVFLEPG